MYDIWLCFIVFSYYLFFFCGRFPYSIRFRLVMHTMRRCINSNNNHSQNMFNKFLIFFPFCHLCSSYFFCFLYFEYFFHYFFLFHIFFFCVSASSIPMIGLLFYFMSSWFWFFWLLIKPFTSSCFFIFWILLNFITVSFNITLFCLIFKPFLL